MQTETRSHGFSSSQLAVEHWNRTPLLYSEEERYSQYPWLYEAAEFRRHSGQLVLEVGCGTGCDLLQFAKNGSRVIGVDITPAHLRLAQERLGSRGQVLYADARRLPFTSGRFDYVYSHGVLHHIDDPRAAVEEIFRVLRPGGRFNVHVYAKWSYTRLYLTLKHKRDWKVWVENSRDPVRIHFYTAAQLCRLFSPYRISVTKYEYADHPRLERWLGWFLVATGEKPRQ